MTYQQAVGISGGGELARSAQGAEQLAVALASGTPLARAGQRAFQDGLGCAACHGMQAQGERAPRLSGGRDLRRFRRKHGQGLFPAAIVSDQQFAAINTWLATNPAGGARTSAGG